MYSGHLSFQDICLCIHAFTCSFTTPMSFFQAQVLTVLKTFLYEIPVWQSSKPSSVRRRRHADCLVCIAVIVIMTGHVVSAVGSVLSEL